MRVTAFDAAYARGIRLFEADLHWTSDRRIVLVHDWDDAYAWWFSPWPRAISLAWRRIAGPPAHRDFMAARMRGGLTQMDLEALLDWMRRHPDARVITDAKADNLAVLRAIAEQAAGGLQAFIPQAYAPDEVAEIRRLGFQDVILTLYRIPGAGGAELEAALGGLDLFALPVPAHRANALMALALAAGIRGAVHTINDPAAATRLASVGATLLYTDYLVPARD